ncbi:MAG TPA: hypothetical protein VFP84_06205 [Kofleriaceae bacterium]|nr:hypothetical protein [Kofleriaceae bacterium]
MTIEIGRRLLERKWIMARARWWEVEVEERITAPLSAVKRFVGERCNFELALNHVITNLAQALASAA